MTQLAMPAISREKMKAEIENLYDQAGFDHAVIYLQVSRGVARRYHGFPEKPVPQIIMTVRRVVEENPDKWMKGIAAITVEDIRWGRCDIKTVQLLPNAMAKQKALEAGVYDAIFVSREGIVREATSANVFIIKDGLAHTHPLTENLLSGITRKFVFEVCREIDQPVEEGFYTKDELYNADEVFLTGTITEILPIIEIDGKPIGRGKVGEVSRRIFDEMRRRAMEG
jgi:D-alanine transaminase